MSRLDAELRRLYLLPAPPSPAMALPPLADGGAASTADAVRALALGVRQPAQWDRLLAVWQGVQADFGLPAPAIAVSGSDGHWLWFSLAQAVPRAQAAAFVAGLRTRYLAQLPPERTVLMPDVTHGEPGGKCWQPADHLPCREVLPGQWSAFVAADLARIFEDEPWLDRCPTPMPKPMCSPVWSPCRWMISSGPWRGWRQRHRQAVPHFPSALRSQRRPAAQPRRHRPMPRHPTPHPQMPCRPARPGQLGRARSCAR